MSTESKTTYTLFRRVGANELAEKRASHGVTISWGFLTPPKESWQRDDAEEKTAAEESPTLEFVCHVKSAKEIAAAVRRAPLESYLLFRGEMAEVKVAMPVFIDGKNLETYDAEWTVGGVS